MRFTSEQRLDDGVLEREFTLGEIPGIHHGTYGIRGTEPVQTRFWWQAFGYTPAGVECWNGIRAIDYLVSRPEVDPEHLGAAGCSGGGALTTFTAALDSRIKAVIPACFPNSYRLVFAAASGFNSEMTLPQHISRGLDTADFVELSAPTPWLIQATEHDYFTPPGAKLVYEEARRWFQLNTPNQLAFTCIIKSY